MSDDKEFLNYLVELLEPSGNISSCRMFGGYCVRKDGLAIALIFNGTAYFKVDNNNRHDYEKAGSKPFTYTTRNKEVIISNWELPIDILEDNEKLLEWAEKSYQAALAAKKK